MLPRWRSKIASVAQAAFPEVAVVCDMAEARGGVGGGPFEKAFATACGTLLGSLNCTMRLRTMPAGGRSVRSGMVGADSLPHAAGALPLATLS